MKRLLSLIMLLALALSLSGCFLFEAHETDKKLTTFLTDSPVVSVRYYYMEMDGHFRFEDLDEDKLDGFVDRLDSMKLESGGARDYFWGGQFGIEMELEDGTYLTYDGTCLEHRNAKIGRRYDSDDRIRKRFVSVTDCDFWDVMKEYFPSIEEHKDVFKG